MLTHLRPLLIYLLLIFLPYKYFLLICYYLYLGSIDFFVYEIRILKVILVNTN